MSANLKVRGYVLSVAEHEPDEDAQRERHARLAAELRQVVVEVPHFGVSAGASCANRATSAARSSAFQSVGMCAILCVITHRAPAVPA